MNKVILMGRLVADPEVRYTQKDNGTSGCVARYRLAVNRQYNKNGEQQADYFNCVGFGKTGEFAEKYLKKGSKILITGRLQSGSYTNKDGATTYTTDVIVEAHEFCESKGSASGNAGGVSQEIPAPMTQQEAGGFMDVPDGYDEELPFN